MSRSQSGRRSPAAIPVLFGALLAGTALYLVPALAVGGQLLPALFAALVWLGIGVLWFLVRREGADAAGRVDAQARTHHLYRSLLEHGSEAHIIIDADGAVVFASENVRTVLGIDPDRLEDSSGLLELVRDHDRRRVLHAFASLRRQPGMSVALEIGGWHPDGGDCFLDLRAVNLSDAAVGGILITIRDITPRKTVESEIQHLAFYDAVTGLDNRRFFFEQGKKALALARRHEGAAAVFSLDLDGFKQVIDTLGHDHGDQLLQIVARALQQTLRDTDVVGRLGADEFAIVLTEVRDVGAAARVAHRLLDTLPATVREGEREAAVGASLGVAMFPDDGEDLEGLLKAADTAMYRAKTEGRGVQFYRPELRTVLSDQMRMEQDLKRGLERHELHLHYQPVFHLMTGQMVGAEALSRWRHFTRGMVSASEFIRLAERSGLIRSLDRWALARGVHQRATHPGGWVGWVSVNLSVHTLSDPDLARYVRDLLEATDLHPGSLVLEIPEEGVPGDPAVAADLLWELKNTGAAIALDNFGAGAASFSRLKQLPIDILKLHPEFVRGIGGGEGDEHLVEAAISVAHGIRAKVLAKDIEREDQLVWLRDGGCDFIQGHLMGAPVPADRLGQTEYAEEEVP